MGQEYNNCATGNICPQDMSLLRVCTTCHGKCCVGRTLVKEEERKQIGACSGNDHFVHWRNDLYYLDRGTCPYLKSGLCSVQNVKPFVCQIFPFVPRVINGQLWLYCVWECDAAVKLPAGFVDKAMALTRAFFRNRNLQEYAEYWDQNKVGDFNDERVVCKVRVFDGDKVGVK